MSFYSPWLALLLTVVLYGLAATPLCRPADSSPSKTRSRVSTLDGLRGFLALAVFFHHGAIYHTYIQTALWTPPPDRLYALLGSFGVAMFFMITGFLFWSKILRNMGKPLWLPLYIGRIFRIGPIYILAISLMVLAVFADTHWQIQVSRTNLMASLIDWGLLGLKSGAPINGMASPGVFLAYVTWSLHWEWLFYASLLVTSLFARKPISAWALPACGLLLSVGLLLFKGNEGEQPQAAAFVALFCVGMLTAALREIPMGVAFEMPIFSGAALAVIAAVLAFFPTAYAVGPICLLGSAFFLIANGSSLFGLLTSRPARRLGDISFGIYLLQGLVLAAAFSTEGARRFALSGPLGHWLLIAASGVVLIVVSTAVHALIERPGTDLGHRLVAQLRGKGSSPQATG